MSLKGLVSYRVVRLGDREVDVVRTAQDNPVLRLAAGRYRIEGRFGAANAVETLTVTLSKGDDQNFSMEHHAGILELRLSAIQHGLALADVFWDITALDGRCGCGAVGRQSHAFRCALVATKLWLNAAASAGNVWLTWLQVRSRQ